MDSENKELDFNFDDILRDLSPFVGFYKYLFVLMISLVIISLFFKVSYQGILPFTRSMIYFSNNERLIHDIIIICYLISFSLTFFKYLFFGVSARTKIRIKKHEKLLQENSDDISNISNRNLVIWCGVLSFLTLICAWFFACGFSSLGNSSYILSNFGGYKYFTFPLFLILVFSGLFLLLIVSIFFMETQKNVM